MESGGIGDLNFMICDKCSSSSLGPRDSKVGSMERDSGWREQSGGGGSGEAKGSK
jgi:hypothetical protein